MAEVAVIIIMPVVRIAFRVMFWGVTNKFEKLERIISISNAELLEGERWQGLNEQNKKKLEDAVNDSEDLLDDCLPVVLRTVLPSRNENIAAKVCNFFSASPTSSNPFVSWCRRGYAMKKLGKALDKISGIRRQCSLESDLQETLPVVREEDVIGRDFEIREILKLVLEAPATRPEAEKILRVVPVFGVEGIGKTALALLVYNLEAVSQQFDLSVWVQISNLVYVVHEKQELGRQIAGKCKGVPLLIRHVGSSMARGSVDEWQSFLDEEKFAKVAGEIGRVTSYSFERQEEVIGRDADKEAIIKQLLECNSEDDIFFMSICGTAGLGKTALARFIFNDSQVRDHFDLRIWVSVADVFDLKVILKKILESVTTTHRGDLSIEELGWFIHRETRGARCLLILDDVWDGLEFQNWSDFRFSFPLDGRGWRCIITTRSEEVASITAGEKHTYKLKSLDDNSSWSLFVKVAIGKEQKPTNWKIIKIAKEIVAKCGGIPLNIRTIGGILYFKNSETEWQSFYEKELRTKLIGEGKLESLELSYDQLPSILKPCLAYCALFPRDYEIDVQTLINLWMSQGFIRQDSDLNPEALGYHYFVELLRRSFFQETMRDELGYITKCIMENSMREFARSKNVCATVGLKGGTNDTKLRYVSFDFHVDSSWHIRMLSQSKRIRSLMLHGQSRLEVQGRSSESVCEEITKYKYLRQLDLHNSGIKVVSDSIGDLIHLSNLQKLPKAIKNLVNLRNLENESCFGLTCMPRGLGQLTVLRTLSEFVLSNGTGSVSNKSGKLSELGELYELRGQLKIKNLRRLGGDCTTRANLKEKNHLVSLVLIWVIDATIPAVDFETLLEDLQPHPDLRELSLSAYGGVHFSSWLPGHKNLVKFSLSRCMNCKCLPPLHHLPHLEVLLVDDMPELEYISDKTSEDILGTFFESLKELQLTNLPKLARWWNDAANVEEKTLPHLSKLIIEDCPNLIFMPLFPCLEELLVLNKTRWEPFQKTIAARQVPSTTSEASSSTSSTNFAPVVPLSKLKNLYIINMPNGDPTMCQSLPSLRSLTFDHVQDINAFLEVLEKVTNLQELHIWRCASLKEIGWVSNIRSLRILSIKLCPNLMIPRDKINLITSLQKVEIKECHQVSHIELMLEGRFYMQ
ncbi:hypothetical protein TIFTF001_036095 [Ficus carica]|uniref:NB-ARC domain-containing protein n=1 Tax=Ficus carica TaxID=3494 RepID=A0AA88J791_FICCA|nr:hypothetical protein TIFTF001_036094 [Ficus carica]GMN67038.1 hypothetical protein TIFTF001_036095 [Ficus carica]